MPLVFKTLSDSADRVEIVGAGVLFPFGKGGVTVARAAETMPELQEKNPDGSIKLDEDGNPVPLSGSKLTAAAKEFADARGFTTVNLSESQIEGLAQEAGTVPDPQPLAEAGAEDYARMYGEGLQTVNDDPEALVDPGPGDGVVAVPEGVVADQTNDKNQEG